MSRVVKIEKVGKSTIVEIINNGETSKVYLLNKLTNVSLMNNCLNIHAPEIKVFIQYDELFNKLGSVDIKDYLHKAAALFLFNQ